MHQSTTRANICAALLLAAAISACGPRDNANQEDSLTQSQASGTVAPEMLKVAEVQIGDSIGADMRVMTPMTQFTAKDTVFISVSTMGAGQDASLMLVVTPLAGAADSTNTIRDNKTISPTAPAVTEFHFFKPTGLKLGKYKAEVFLNGGLADTKEFEIVKTK